MRKTGTSGKQRKSGTRSLKAHEPFASKELKDSPLVAETLLECIRTGDLDSFREVLMAHLEESSKHLPHGGGELTSICEQTPRTKSLSRLGLRTARRLRTYIYGFDLLQQERCASLASVPLPLHTLENPTTEITLRFLELTVLNLRGVKESVLVSHDVRSS
jgi:hypothetical protein